MDPKRILIILFGFAVDVDLTSPILGLVLDSTNVVLPTALPVFTAGPNTGLEDEVVNTNSLQDVIAHTLQHHTEESYLKNSKETHEAI